MVVMMGVMMDVMMLVMVVVDDVVVCGESSVDVEGEIKGIKGYDYEKSCVDAFKDSYTC